jgi:vitamin K-dependent gamma-carboxylase
MLGTTSAITTPPRGARTPPWWRRLFATCDISSLVLFRITFGALMLLDVVRSFPSIQPAYLEPSFHFTFYGLDWVRPWPGHGMYVHFGVLALAALFIAIGLCYRAAALVFFVGVSYVFLLEQGTYLNHIYLIALLSFLLIFVPAHRAGSVDAWLRPGLRSQVARRCGALWLLRAQVGLPYFYGGVAKLNPDWLRGLPLKLWLEDYAERPVIGPLLAQDWVAYLFSYGGLALDLLIVPALLWARTRPWAYALALGFHLTNSLVFDIGVFPWLMIAATTIFFPPDWPRRLRSRLAALAQLPPSPAPALSPPPTRLGRAERVTLGLFSAYLAWQLLFPLRHWLYPGDVAWTEEGHKFAWRMKLRDKHGSVRFYAHDPATRETLRVDPRRYLARWQYYEMAARPEMIHQFARHLADRLRAQGRDAVEIHVVARISLNGREPQLLIDPEVDLAAVRPSLRPAPWILRDLADR